MSIEQQAVAEFTRNAGRDQPDREWILSNYDSWHRNPVYSGPKGRHPEDDQEEQPIADIQIDGPSFECPF